MAKPLAYVPVIKVSSKQGPTLLTPAVCQSGNNIVSVFKRFLTVKKYTRFFAASIYWSIEDKHVQPVFSCLTMYQELR